jgi:UDP-N-acetylglucosamine 2-epimerase (non-hydrolysing)
MSLPQVHLVGGTSAEAARLAPVAAAMRDQGRLEPILVAAGPDPLAFTRTLTAFDRTPGLAVPAGSSDAELICRLDQLWATRTPAAIMVQGDGGGSLPAALAAHWRRIPVVHLDAGRRSGELGSSTLAETNRRLLAQVATVHLAATPLAAMNLLDERIAGGDILLTGNTSVDAARAMSVHRFPYADPALAEMRSGGANRLLVVAVESAGSVALESVRAAVRRLVAGHPDLDVVMLGSDPHDGSRRIAGAAQPAYPDRARLFAEAYLILTDDAEPHEEALAFGVPALVLRELTDRMESMFAGCARLVGATPEAIVTAVSELLDSRVRRDAMTAAGNPYGDGLAARRAAQATAALLGHGPFPDPMPARHVAGISR